MKTKLCVVHPSIKLFESILVHNLKFQTTYKDTKSNQPKMI